MQRMKISASVNRPGDSIIRNVSVVDVDGRTCKSLFHRSGPCVGVVGPDRSRVLRPSAVSYLDFGGNMWGYDSATEAIA